MQDRQWVLVTGGSRGIGRAIVKQLQQHYFVVFTYQKSTEAAKQLVNELGDNVIAYQCDGSNSEQCDSLFHRLQKLFIRAPFAIINNLGVTDDQLAMSMSFSQWRTVTEVNIHSVFYTSQPWLTLMAEQRQGVIINISSVSAIKGNKGQAHYAASKAAIIGFTKTLALEMGRFNVRVNAVIPGLIETDMLKNIPEKSLKDLKKQIPLKRFGQVDEVAYMVEFLLSDKASYMTGQSLVLDGGLTV